ncbi:MAG: acyl-CoA dehydratase activase [Firmicutes bacterium]|nr:acyl-CoA dehydratase activase [Bacillota bacterium]
MVEYYLGVDIGSLTTKVVLVDGAGNLVGRVVRRSGYRGKEVALSLVDELLRESGLSAREVARTVATGYGRVTFPADREISEISCQAAGVVHLFPGVRTVIDIGGQDSKVMQVLPSGRVVDFAMNDKCAAGTGRFLEVMAQALEVRVEDLGKMASAARERCSISSVCTVFAESEVVSNLARGAAREDIVAGVCMSVASRVAAMASRLSREPEVAFTGGVARNAGVVRALADELGQTLLVPPDPEITAALGAALLARGKP